MRLPVASVAGQDHRPLRGQVLSKRRPQVRQVRLGPLGSLQSICRAYTAPTFEDLANCSASRLISQRVLLLGLPLGTGSAAVVEQRHRSTQSRELDAPYFAD